MEKYVPEIVVTGGPCGGKSSGIEHLSEKLWRMGIRPFVVPEVATMFFSHGIRDVAKIAKENPELYFKIQGHIMLAIVSLRRRFNELAREFNGKSVILFDRGPKDAEAYMRQEFYYDSLKEAGLSVYDVRDSFDGVIHLVTAADGAEDFYTKENNRARREDPVKARFVDKETQWAWVGARHFRIIDNRTDFDGKLERLLQAVLGILSEAPLEIERKFLLARKPDFQLYPLWRAEILFIEQMYLVRSLEGISRIRKRTTVKFARGRSQGDSTSYYKARKIDISPGVRREDEHEISFNEYEHLATFKDFDRRVVRKHRHCFVYNNQYFELDVFISPEWAKGLCLLEIELLNENDFVDLPPFLNIEKEVTDDPCYSNYEIARRR